MPNNVQKQQSITNTTDYSDLTALTVNCTLKRSPGKSHTDKLLEIVRTILEEKRVSVEQIRAVDHHIAPGVYPDMTEHGAPRDNWPQIWPKVLKADILIIGTPIWLGEKSSVCQSLVERLYGHSGETNEKGQYIFYGKTGGCFVTGNEDGIKHVAMGILYSLQHLGYTIPPQADAGWIGEAGPGPSYGDKRDDGTYVGFDNDFTNRNTTFATWNMLHIARMLKDAGGLPSYGNSKKLWSDGLRFDSPNPEYR